MKYISLVVQIAIIVVLTLAVVTNPVDAFASETTEAGASGIPTNRIVITHDPRVDKLEAYLTSHNSPLASYASVFIEKADSYGLDWRLVASISGVESTFGKKLPRNSYNAYGWNGGNFYFKNWEDGIETVSRTLREKYMDKWGADTPYKIGPYYAPPSRTWAGKVTYFMNQIEIGPKTESATLALKLTI